MSKAILNEENPAFITDPKGKKLGVVLSIKEYKRIMEQLEDAHDITEANKRMKEPAMDQAKLDRELKKHGIL